MTPEQPSAAILVIGDEILSGWTQDTNSSFLCKHLTARSIEVRRIVTVPDELDEIVTVLTRLISSDYTYIFTSGGLGPTPDDVTRPAVAAALGVGLLLDQTAARRYEVLRGEPLNTKQLEMCRLPTGAHPLYGETTGAPGFLVKNIYVLPGVPQVLQEMWAGIDADFAGQPAYVQTFITHSRESEFAAEMEEYQLAYPELKFGSYPRLKSTGWEVTIRVRGSNRELVQQIAARFMVVIGGEPIDGA
ncbi:MAG: molybdopterin-binding protein [bacterium]|nr:molybdopterin-binding protein [bacterium]